MNAMRSRGSLIGREILQGFPYIRLTGISGNKCLNQGKGMISTKQAIHERRETKSTS